MLEYGRGLTTTGGGAVQLPQSAGAVAGRGTDFYEAAGESQVTEALLWKASPSLLQWWYGWAKIVCV